ncbi:MAG: hypothetical protein IRZ28_09855 [Steroidobacteraceae bacterium]|nr:hypothetical protein [Steroidobacteraceae bacterium]
MSRYLIELRTLADWQARLGDPERHWKRHASAMELAVSWFVSRTSERGIPADVAALLDQEPAFSGATLKLAIPERRTTLEGRGFPTQTDIWALLRSPGGLISLSVEGKAREPFGETVDMWLAAGRRLDRGTPAGREARLKALAERLGLDTDSIGGLRYQLLHRTAAALIEAEDWHAAAAIMLVQRFTSTPREMNDSWADFCAFAARLGADIQPGTLARTSVPGRTPLYLAWLNCRYATDDEILLTMTGERGGRPRPLEQRNAFEALCELAGRERWCWNLGCTTCGCMHFRYGLRELALGRHPDADDWVTRKDVRQRDPLPKIPFPRDDQGAIARIAAGASIGRIASAGSFPAWLGFLGVVLFFCEDAERDDNVLTRAWVPQLCELLPTASPLRQRLWEKVRGGLLSLRDLESIERELMRR